MFVSWKFIRERGVVIDAYTIPLSMRLNSWRMRWAITVSWSRVCKKHTCQKWIWKIFFLWIFNKTWIAMYPVHPLFCHPLVSPKSLFKSIDTAVFWKTIVNLINITLYSVDTLILTSFAKHFSGSVWWRYDQNPCICRLRLRQVVWCQL